MYQRVDFKALKAKVSVLDVAAHLGYRVNAKAGLGKHLELVLGDERSPSDKIIVNRYKDAASQTFFRRDGSSGDVITLIKEHLNSFHVTGNNDWERVAKVLANLANEPISLPETYRTVEQKPRQTTLDLSQFDIDKLTNHPQHAQAIFDTRGINKETIAEFSAFLHRIKDKRYPNTPYNVGFPYRVAGNDDIVGYETRGFKGFKGKAPGTNSSTGAWIADLSENQLPEDKTKVFFFESAFDAMAFYQFNRLSIDRERSVFVSIGGTFSDGQIKTVLGHYSNAKAVDCFDNDIPGNTYGIRMAALAANLNIHISKQGELFKIASGNDFWLFQAQDFHLAHLSKYLPFDDKSEMMKAPANFKDWNDVILNKPIAPIQTVSKYERDINLQQRRQLSV